jgi:hypothetical protein
MRPLVFVAAVLLVVAACSGEPAPIEPEVSASSLTPPRPTSTLTPPTLPKPAERKDATGAANFVLYWVKVTDYASWSGDTDILRSLGAASCGGCNDYVDLIDRTYAAGGFFRGGKRTLSSCRHEVDGPTHYFTCEVSASPSTFRLSTNGKVQKSPQAKSNVEYAVSRWGDVWQLKQIGLAN